MTSYIKVQLVRLTDHMRRGLFGMSPKYLCQLNDNLFVGGQPTKRGYKILKQWGITAIVSLRRTAPKHIPSGITMLHLPTPDHAPIDLADLEKAVHFIHQQAKAYVHCHWGEGRAVSVAAAYLISKGFSVDQALKYIKQRRIFIQPNKYQLARLHEFARTIGQVRGS